MMAAARVPVPPAVLLSRVLASVLGSAAADSLGSLVEFQSPGTFHPVGASTFTEWQEERQPQPNPWGLRAGNFTDGTCVV